MNFKFPTKLGVEMWHFHDRDISLDGKAHIQVLLYVHIYKRFCIYVFMYMCIYGSFHICAMHIHKCAYIESSVYV